MQGVQLELDFSMLIKRAKTSFSVEQWQKDWSQLCLVFDTEIEEAAIQERLAVEVNAIVELAEVIYVRASRLGSFSMVEKGEIAFEEDFFDQFLAQPPTFDPDKYLLKDDLYQRSPSQATVISKDKALEFAYEPEPEHTLAEAEVVEKLDALEYDENVSGWAEVIQTWLKKHKLQSAALAQLEQNSGLSIVQLLLAGLLQQGVLEIQLEEGREAVERFYERGGVAIGLVV